MDYSLFYYVLSMIFSASLAVFVTIACADISPSQPPEPKKIIIKTANQVAKMLADILEGTEEASDEDKDYLFHLLVCTMADDNHPDFYEFNYIGRKILAGEQANVAWDTWLTIALRRLAKDTTAKLPEAWFIEFQRETAITTPEPTPILSALEKDDIDEIPSINLPEEAQVEEKQEAQVEEKQEAQVEEKQEAQVEDEAAIAATELDQSVTSESVVSESDSDDLNHLLTEAGPMASPPAQTEGATQIFSEEKTDLTTLYKPVNKYIELATGEERDLTAVD
jgi:hypothetical protein